MVRCGTTEPGVRPGFRADRGDVTVAFLCDSPFVGGDIVGGAVIRWAVCPVALLRLSRLWGGDRMAVLTTGVTPGIRAKLCLSFGVLLRVLWCTGTITGVYVVLRNGDARESVVNPGGTASSYNGLFYRWVYFMLLCCFSMFF